MASCVSAPSNTGSDVSSMFAYNNNNNYACDRYYVSAMLLLRHFSYTKYTTERECSAAVFVIIWRRFRQEITCD